MINVVTGEWYFYFYDALGNVVALCDDTGTIVEGYSYDIYGASKVHTGPGADTLWLTGDDTISGSGESSIGNPYRFTGRRYDEETGLYYYRARYYNPEIGRFLSPDPIGYDDGMNMYTYCGSNPVNRNDPFGDDWIREGGAALWYIGPIDTVTVRYIYGSKADKWSKREAEKRIAKDVIKKTEDPKKKRELQILRSRMTNALRHAYWSAQLYRNLSIDDAEQAL